MAMESSPENPLALGRVVQAVKGWVERCGAVWVEAQVIQINRKAGSSTVYMTMRDTIANSSAILSMFACVRSGDVMRSLSTGYLCCSSSCCFVLSVRRSSTFRLS